MANNSPITLVGNIARDPELTTTPGGHAKLSFAVATEHRFQRDNEWVSEPSFFNVVLWRNTAEQANKTLVKGMPVIVTGRMDQRSWKTDDGDNRSFIEVVADSIAINVWAVDSVTRRQSGAATTSAPTEPTPAPAEAPW